MISDEMLKKAVTAFAEESLIELPQEQDHVFSKRFEKKMNKLVKAERKSFYPFTNTLGKRFAVSFAVILILSTTMVMSVSALRDGIYEMVQQIYEKFSIITYQSDEPSPNIDKPFVEYELTELPEGYVLTEETIIESIKTKVAFYEKDRNTISFDQCPIETADFTINTEGVTLEELFIDDQTLYYYSNLGIQNVFWDNGEYVFFISGEIDKETLLNLVNHTNIKEK